MNFPSDATLAPCPGNWVPAQLRLMGQCNGQQHNYILRVAIKKGPNFTFYMKSKAQSYLRFPLVWVHFNWTRSWFNITRKEWLICMGTGLMTPIINIRGKIPKPRLLSLDSDVYSIKSFFLFFTLRKTPQRRVASEWQGRWKVLGYHSLKSTTSSALAGGHAVLSSTYALWVEASVLASTFPPRKELGPKYDIFSVADDFRIRNPKILGK